MALTPAQAALSIAVMAGVTFLTRFLPFLLFDRGGKPPRIVLYLGRVLPPAIIMMLIIYGTIIAGMWFGGKMVFAGTLDTGKLMTYFTYITQIMVSLMMVSRHTLGSP